ncbi:hypothetical protein [Brevundimonas sp. UBA7507]|uniref:hypothetical protein n=1 Tax=Brevundimonas sp. UBA7507 TaxID=1946137 RepID=UPI00257A2DC6|nr:hypothetical protein [Brevundimonas sp. UBA7507]
MTEYWHFINNETKLSQLSGHHKMNSSRKKLVHKPVCLMVLGPHRSGTSALSGVLSYLGGDLPKTLMPAGEGNARGYFESRRVMTFNDRILNVLGSDWNDLSPLDPGSITVQVFESLVSEAVEVLQDEFSAAKLPLLKDPRICRFVGFWTEAFSRAGYETLFIHTHRNPLETAQSLQKRDGIPIELGLLIWLRHVLDAEAATRGKVRVFTSYKGLLEDWRGQIAQIEHTLGLTFHRNTGKMRSEIDSFLTGSLRHEQRTLEDVQKSAQVADAVRETFQILESWTGGAGDSSDHGALDVLRGRMDGALDVVTTFLQALDAGKHLSSELTLVEQRAQLLQNEKVELATELERNRKAGAEKVTQIAALEQRGETYRGEATRLTAELESERRAGAERDKEWATKIAELEQRAQLLQNEKVELATELERNRKAGAEKVTQIAELEQRGETYRGEATRLTAELESERRKGAEREKEWATKIAELDQRAQLLQNEKVELATELERNRKAGAEKVTQIAELEQRVETSQGEAIRLTAELESERRKGAEREKEWATKIAELEQRAWLSQEANVGLTNELERHRKASADIEAEQAEKISEIVRRVGLIHEEKVGLTTEFERHRKASAAMEAEQAARIADLEGTLRQRTLEAEEWFDGNRSLMLAQAALQDELKKLEEKQAGEVESLTEKLRSRDKQISNLENNVEDRFKELAVLSQMLLDIQVDRQKEWENLRQSREQIASLIRRNEQLRNVGIKKLMARSSRKLRLQFINLFKRDSVDSARP